MTISNLNNDKIKSSELVSKVNELVTQSNSAATEPSIKIFTATLFGPFGLYGTLVASGSTTTSVNLNLASRFSAAGVNTYNGENNVVLGIFHAGNAFPGHACYAFPNYVSNPLTSTALTHRIFQNNSDKSQTIGSFAIAPVATDSNGVKYLQLKIHDPSGDGGHSSAYEYHVIGYAK